MLESYSCKSKAATRHLRRTAYEYLVVRPIQTVLVFFVQSDVKSLERRVESSTIMPVTKALIHRRARVGAPRYS